MIHYFVSGVVGRIGAYKCFDIVEEKDGVQSSFALVPFSPRGDDAYKQAKLDASNIVKGLNLLEKSK